MKEVKVKGLLVKAPEEIAVAFDEVEEKEDTTLSAEEVEALIKEISEWLDSGNYTFVKKARQMEKQTATGVAPWETSAVVPSGARVSNVGTISGVVAAPNLPSWLTGTPQGAAAAAQMTAASVAESVMGVFQQVFNNVIQEVARMLGSFADAHARIFSELGNKVAEGMKDAVEAQKEIADLLREVIDELKNIAPEEAKEVEELVPAELPPAEIPPVGEETPPVETPAAEEETTAAEVPPPPAAEEEEEKERPVPEVTPTAAMFSPQFLTTLTQHLSQMTKEILETRAAKPPTSTTPERVQQQNAFQIAEIIKDSIAKAVKSSPQVERDMTEAITQAQEPEEGEGVAAQIEGQEKSDVVKKPLKEAKRSKKE